MAGWFRATPLLGPAAACAREGEYPEYPAALPLPPPPAPDGFCVPADPATPAAAALLSALRRLSSSCVRRASTALDSAAAAAWAFSSALLARSLIISVGLRKGEGAFGSCGGGICCETGTGPGRAPPFCARPLLGPAVTSAIDAYSSSGKMVKALGVRRASSRVKMMAE